MAITEGDTVSLEYTGKLENGEVFDTSEGREPLTFQIGAGMVIPGFEQGVVGLDEGEEKTLEVPPEEGYGERREELVKEIPREQLQGEGFEEGQVLGLQSEDGQQFQATVRSIDEQKITLDFNHFLAGQTLVFEVKVVGVESN